MAHFTHQFPTDPSNFVHFRNRIGKVGLEVFFYICCTSFWETSKRKGESIRYNSSRKQHHFPTDPKLAKTIIDKCNEIA